MTGNRVLRYNIKKKRLVETEMKERLLKVREMIVAQEMTHEVPALAGGDRRLTEFE